MHWISLTCGILANLLVIAIIGGRPHGAQPAFLALLVFLGISLGGYGAILSLIPLFGEERRCRQIAIAALILGILPLFLVLFLSSLFK